MFGSLIDFIGVIIAGSVLLVIAIYLQLRRRQQQRAELESHIKELERRAELESHVKELERRVSKLEESLKKQ
ncbi:MAG TPA: hypothetical protein VHO70_04855 [Chitinispirillaceae bacterium]|nr:hypothetical protein [Chitinispirillaceae bacterium]